MSRIKKTVRLISLAVAALLGGFNAWAADLALPERVKPMALALAKITEGPSAFGARNMLELSRTSPSEFYRAASHLQLLSQQSNEDLATSKGVLKLDKTMLHWIYRANELATKPVGDPLSPVHAQDDAREMGILKKIYPIISDKYVQDALKSRFEKLEADGRQAKAVADEVRKRLEEERRDNPDVEPKMTVEKLTPNLHAVWTRSMPREERVQRMVGRMASYIVKDSLMISSRNRRVVQHALSAREMAWRLADPAKGVGRPSEREVLETADALIEEYLNAVDSLDLDYKFKGRRQVKMARFQKAIKLLKEGGRAP